MPVDHYSVFYIIRQDKVIVTNVLYSASDVESRLNKSQQSEPYDYFEYLLTEIPEHLDDTDRSFLDDLLPWSPNLPANCRKPDKEEVK